MLSQESHFDMIAATTKAVADDLILCDAVHRHTWSVNVLVPCSVHPGRSHICDTQSLT